MWYNRDHKVCRLFRLATFPQEDAFKIPRCLLKASWLFVSLFILLLPSYSLSGCNTVCLPIHLLEDILVGSKIWWLQTKLLIASACRFLWEHKFSAQGARLLDHLVRIQLVSLVRKCQTVFQSGCVILCSCQQWIRAPATPHPHQHLMPSKFWILAVLIGV